MLFGYARPTHDDPDLSIQIQELSTINDIQIIQENHDSAKERVALEDMIQNLQVDDQVIVFRLYNLADSSLHLVELLDDIEQKGASLVSLKENIDSKKVDGYSFGAIVRHLVQFQSDVISEKTKIGLNEAQKRGNNAGRPRKPDENVKKAILMHGSNKLATHLFLSILL